MNDPELSTIGIFAMLSYQDDWRNIRSQLSEKVGQNIVVFNDNDGFDIVKKVAKEFLLPINRGWWWEINNKFTLKKLTPSQFEYQQYDELNLKNTNTEIYLIITRDLPPIEWIVIKCKISDVLNIIELFDYDLEYYVFDIKKGIGILNSNEDYIQILYINR